jgi:imidazolonepropionase-like amidohydrolase
MPGFRRDVRLETLAAIVDNEIHVRCHSYGADEMYMMLRGGGGRFPATRMGVEAVFRRGFQDALAYKEQRRLHEEGRMPGFRRDVRLETLAAIVDNEIHVQCHSYRADEIYMMLRVCEEFGIEAPTFQHVLEGYKVAPELAAYGAMASTFSDWWAYKYEVKDAIPWNVEIMHKAGVIVSINSDSDEMIRRLNSEAGKALRYGQLSYEDAMKTTTLNSAKQLWIDDRLGTLEVGKLGSVTVYDAPPLSSYARCLLTVARGVVLYEANPEHEQRWQDYAAASAAFAAASRADTSEESADILEGEVELDDVTGAAEETAAEETDAEETDAEETDAEETDADADADAWERWTRPGRGQAYLIENAIIHTMTGEPFLGSVFVKDGRIAQVGTEVEPDVACEVVDATGKHLYPAFLDADDTTGLYEIGQVSVSVDESEIGGWNPDLSAAAAVHADSAHHNVTRLTGIGYVLVSPQSGTIRGQSALVQLDGTTTDDLIAVRDLGLHINFPRVRRFDEDDGPETPDTVAELDRWFDDALAWGERVDRLAAAGRATAMREPQLEALLPYARGEKPVFLEASSAAQLMMAHAWAGKRGLDAVLVGADEAWKVAGYLGADGARVIVGPVHALPRGEGTPFDTPFRLPWVLSEAGCEVALRTNDPEQTRNLPFQAATASAWGFGRDRTLHALTLGAARIIGVDAFCGSIEAGKVASFFLADGDPLDFTGKVERMWIGGGEIPLESKQTLLRERYLERLGPGADRTSEVQ